MLKVGDEAPPIDAVASDGKRFVLYEQAGLCTVVYFFPKAFTPGCTVETREFGKHYVELDLAGATVVGVSTDDLDTQCRFAQSMAAPFPMLGDRDRAICRAYDVLWPLVGIAHRVTYVLAPHDAGDARRWKVEGVFHHEIKVGAHRDEVLRFVNEKFRARRAKLEARANGGRSSSGRKTPKGG
jgi:peroxiredoxin